MMNANMYQTDCPIDLIKTECDGNWERVLNDQVGALLTVLAVENFFRTV